MNKKHIYLCCGGGLSSGFLAQKARAAAKKEKLDVTIEAKSESEVSSYLSKMDILCIGPHYAFRLDSFKEMAAPYGFPVIVIPDNIYSMIDGPGFLKLAMNVMRNNK
ncbi:MAG: PTS sugar transporter subunit IIB [Lactobacillus panisapium]